MPDKKPPKLTGAQAALALALKAKQHTLNYLKTQENKNAS